MSNVDKAIATQLANIETRTGLTLAQFAEIVRRSGLTKHGEIRDLLKRDLGLGHGDANTVIHLIQKSRAPQDVSSGADTDRAVAEIYAGAKADLRPIHDKLMAAIHAFGEFEIAPKKGYVSLRRKKQFAMIGPTTRTRVDLGLNVRGLPANDRLLVMPPNSMCQYQVRISAPIEVDAEVLGWLRQAYDASG